MQKANNLGLLILHNNNSNNNNLLKLALDERQVMSIVSQTLFCNNKSKYGIYV